MDLLVHVHVEGPLDEGQGHLQGLHPQRGAVVSNELQSFDAHQATVAGRVLLQILGAGVDCANWDPRPQAPASESGVVACGHQINHCPGADERPLGMGQCKGLWSKSLPWGVNSQSHMGSQSPS